MTNYLDLAGLIVPILVVLIGGGLAFWQLKYRNKQERIIKWKGEFRNYMGEYFVQVLELNEKLFSMGRDISSDSSIDTQLINEISKGTNRLMAIISQIEMHLDYRNPKEKELMQCFHKQWDFIREAQNGKTEKFHGDLISDVVIAAKKVHKEYRD